MKLAERFWASVTVVVNWLTLSPYQAPNDNQIPVPKIHTTPSTYIAPYAFNVDPELEYDATIAKYPSFKPPTGRKKGTGSDLICEYPSLSADWKPCSSAENRECWLKNVKTGQEYNTTTDYETNSPPGIVRNYTIILSNATLNQDGLPFKWGKVFGEHHPDVDGEEWDGEFPGPWIQACWGDTLNVTVYNKLPYSDHEHANGTSIHWHGLRMLNRMQADGVNGVTQCPIAPDDHYTYTFPVQQYGSTWYHSHYSMQYADGTQGPLTLHGPTTAPFDFPLFPTILTDWGHNSAFAAAYKKETGGLLVPSIVLNGAGNVDRFSGTNISTEDIPPIHTVTFEPGKRYLMRIINTAFKTGFRFSIDGHRLLVVQHDLVPIDPYSADTITVHIGQRYNIIVQAKQANDPGFGDGNFWIRTEVCYGVQRGPNAGNDYMKTGIVRYNKDSKADPVTEAPVRAPKCEDEGYGNVHPRHRWQIGRSFNTFNNDENAKLMFGTTEPKDPDYIHASFYWDVKEKASELAQNFRIHYDDPIFLRLADPNPRAQEMAIYGDQKFTNETWAYVVIASAGGHPIHLHGHDFAVVYESDKKYEPGDLEKTCPDNPKFHCDNPMRRDVIMPHGSDTYTVIAFKTDNPGSWLMHCHIAAHAGEGLALQILERPEDAAALWKPGTKVVNETERVCGGWQKWWKHINIIQDDSGI